MNILIISQCRKSALNETRRIVDQFAERKGDRTWQTLITLQGLDTLRRLLRKTARRNTAVACHWIKSGNHSELLWIVGNTRCFNVDGSVPTNSSVRDILRKQHENDWHRIEDISLLSGIAGLFHDIGKANDSFQEKLRNQNRKYKEPCRHEWVSLRLFQAFVDDNTDEQWLDKLAKIQSKDEEALLNHLKKIQDTPKNSDNPGTNPFEKLPPLARTIGWLIVSHHRLPIKKNSNIPFSNERLYQGFSCDWNSPQFKDDRKDKDWEKVWEFTHGTPFNSTTWQYQARKLAQAALSRINFQKDWLNQDRFTTHLARLTLMLADHHYSSKDAKDAKKIWQDTKATCFALAANTDKETKQIKQKLDEHNIGVSRDAMRIAKVLPDLHLTLPTIKRHHAFKQRSNLAAFRWQNKAFDMAYSIRHKTQEKGFFGINMASTGCGKTLANARIFYALADSQRGCRFSIALGLRTLTLQTGDALREKLHLTPDDLAVMIGSEAVLNLHEMKKSKQLSEENNQNDAAFGGSESALDFIPESQQLIYDGMLDDGRLSHWLKKSTKIHQLISAPILVSTIDHLMPATESKRGGKQIAPMLRLLTSDLILDEPDDFDVKDLPALCRLVNWAGILGTRVLLSSATLPPSLVKALFLAYQSGRQHYQAAVGKPNPSSQICCAWFDEFSVQQNDLSDENGFKQAHENFVQKRAEKVQQAKPLRKARLLTISSQTAEVNAPPSDSIIDSIAKTLAHEIPEIHKIHHQIHPETEQTISIGLVRMANINPMIAVAKKLLQYPSRPDHQLHYCVYHARYPLLVRSSMEQKLDAVLMRTSNKNPWDMPEIQQKLTRHKDKKHHIFIVLATSVAEVGRDHDYDWAIAEPSSMRSLIQLAGRVQRHRQQIPKSENILIWHKNYRALIGKKLPYSKPGFETDNITLTNHDLKEALSSEQFSTLNVLPRIQERPSSDPTKNLVDLEHQSLNAQLFSHPTDFGEKPTAKLWWETNIHWSYQLQQATPFRVSTQEENTYYLYCKETDDSLEFHRLGDNNKGHKVNSEFLQEKLQPASGVDFWFEDSFKQLVIELSEQEDKAIDKICEIYAQFCLKELSPPYKWRYNPNLGFFTSLDEDQSFEYDS